ncbi:hypothetical protein RRG08_050786 [Elysia crispata]|uniref:Uncharacterized protein n=1 Tax=Elysia crispata TaxID=231223 RepID=A0AAE1CYX1_9GAST|nr:hypothetical protein RRG08_050786 [Elysia crispata]
MHYAACSVNSLDLRCLLFNEPSLGFCQEEGSLSFIVIYLGDLQSCDVQFSATLRPALVRPSLPPALTTELSLPRDQDKQQKSTSLPGRRLSLLSMWMLPGDPGLDTVTHYAHRALRFGGMVENRL